MAALPRPVVADGPVRVLFDELHALHHRAGWPSLRAIAKDVGCSHTTVSSVFSEPRVPRWGMLELIVESLGGDTDTFHRLWLAASATAQSANGGPTAGDAEHHLAAGPAPNQPAPVPPRQLISDVIGFTGRTAELARLDALVPDGASTTSVVVISGTAGVGKTALAVHWAHRIATWFPDGQLYLNLRGFDPSGSPITATQAVRALLDAFEVPPHRIPTTFDAQVALYRSIVAGRRVLTVLDNARDADQVRPLLPGSVGCLTLVTSRCQLSGLVATEGAYLLHLDLMLVDQARALIATRIGRDRADAEPQAVDQIIDWCARLPLALAVAAARAATHPWFELAEVANELRTARDNLDIFHSADMATDLRAVLSWSYLQLSPEAAQLFRLLGLHPGPDFGTPAAASLAATSLTQVRRLLTELAQLHLVMEHSPGRFRFHDLLRVYAVELARDEHEAERHAAVHRILDHYACAGHTAALLLNPNRLPITMDAPQPGVIREPICDPSAALAWFTIEHMVLLAAIQLAAASNFNRHTWQLAWTLTTFLDRCGHWHDRIMTQQTAVEAAQRLAEPADQACAHRGLGLAHHRLGHHNEAYTHLHHALELFSACKDHSSQADTHLDIAWVLERQGRYDEPLDHAKKALELHRLTGHKNGQARALNATGWLHAQLGSYQTALRDCQHAHDLTNEVGDRLGQAATSDSLGLIHQRLGDHQSAITHYQRAVELFRNAGDRYYEAESLANLGNTYLDATDIENARDHWRTAIALLDELSHPYADKIRDRLNQLS